MDMIVDKAVILPTKGIVEFKGKNSDGIGETITRITFESIEQFYKKIKPHLDRRRLEEIPEGSIG